MRKKIRLFLVLLHCALLLGGFQQVIACSCNGGYKPCESFYRADTVFAGKVVGVMKQMVKVPRLLPEGVEMVGFEQPKEIEVNAFEFEISENFTDSEKLSQMWIVSDYTTCRFHFEKDETYLVYAYQNDEGFYTTDVCTRTRLFSDAKEDLKFLREVLPGPVPEVCSNGRLNAEPANDFWAGNGFFEKASERSFF